MYDDDKKQDLKEGENAGCDLKVTPDGEKPPP